jgi:hypothetical protein
MEHDFRRKQVIVEYIVLTFKLHEVISTQASVAISF